MLQNRPAVSYTWNCVQTGLQSLTAEFASKESDDMISFLNTLCMVSFNVKMFCIVLKQTSIINIL